MNFVQHQPGLRVFYLGLSTIPYTDILLSKNGGPFLPPANRLATMGNGWYSLALSPEDTQLIGPLAWFEAGSGFISQAQDTVAALSHGTIDQTALDLALKDLAAGFPVGLVLTELMKRPLFLFLLALR